MGEDIRQNTQRIRYEVWRKGGGENNILSPHPHLPPQGGKETKQNYYEENH